MILFCKLQTLKFYSIFFRLDTLNFSWFLIYSSYHLFCCFVAVVWYYCISVYVYLELLLYIFFLLFLTALYYHMIMQIRRFWNFDKEILISFFYCDWFGSNYVYHSFNKLLLYTACLKLQYKFDIPNLCRRYCSY
jgi:hypothetical protein